MQDLGLGKERLWVETAEVTIQKNVTHLEKTFISMKGNAEITLFHKKEDIFFVKAIIVIVMLLII